jgi:hypothetical protein
MVFNDDQRQAVPRLHACNKVELRVPRSSEREPAAGLPMKEVPVLDYSGKGLAVNNGGRLSRGSRAAPRRWA